MVAATELALRLVRLYGPLALFLFTFCESSMLFPFLPSEVVVPAAAAVLVTDPPSFVAFVASAGLGGTVGAFVPFYAFYGTRVGRSDWVADRLRITEDRIDRGQEWFRRWGDTSVLWGRFLPGLRSLVSIPAGVANVDPVRFGVLTAIGTVGFYAAVGALVYWGLRRGLYAAAHAFAVARPWLTAALVLLAVVAGGLVFWSRSRSR